MVVHNNSITLCRSNWEKINTIFIELCGSMKTEYNGDNLCSIEPSMN